MREAQLEGALFAKAKAAGVRLDDARLAGAMFPQADLSGAVLTGASAPGSVWVETCLDRADLRRLDATRGVFRHATFAGAQVAGATFVETDLHGVEDPLEGADLRDSRGSIDWRLALERESRRRAGAGGTST